jgi:hypothetical protein
VWGLTASHRSSLQPCDEQPRELRSPAKLLCDECEADLVQCTVGATSMDAGGSANAFALGRNCFPAPFRIVASTHSHHVCSQHLRFGIPMLSAPQHDISCLLCLLSYSERLFKSQHSLGMLHQSNHQPIRSHMPRASPTRLQSSYRRP